MNYNDTSFIIPQTTQVHNDLLNTFYPQRKSLPNWKELGRDVERKDPRFNDKDVRLRKDLGAKSSVIQDIAFNPDTGKAWLKMGGKWYSYYTTPKNFQQFLQSGSLGREMNLIKKGKSFSLSKTSNYTQPNIKNPKISINNKGLGGVSNSSSNSERTLNQMDNSFGGFWGNLLRRLLT